MNTKELEGFLKWCREEFDIDIADFGSGFPNAKRIPEFMREKLIKEYEKALHHCK